ncbi:hypothetical protein A6R68_05305, partial [Neotoma lepida]
MSGKELRRNSLEMNLDTESATQLLVSDRSQEDEQGKIDMDSVLSELITRKSVVTIIINSTFTHGIRSPSPWRIGDDYGGAFTMGTALDLLLITTCSLTCVFGYSSQHLFDNVEKR